MDLRVHERASEGLQEPVLDAVQRRGLCTQKETRQDPILSSQALSQPQPMHLHPGAHSLLKSTSYCMGADSYLFIKLFWNSYSTTNLSYVFFKKKAFTDKL